MANALRGEADASFDVPGEDGAAPTTRVLHLVMDNEAWIEIEQVLDLSYLDVVTYMLATEAAGLSPKLKTTRALLYGATRERHSSLSLADCGALMMRHGDKIAVPMGVALRGSLPWKELAPGEAKPAKAPAPKKPKRGAGMSS